MIIVIKWHPPNIALPMWIAVLSVIEELLGTNKGAGEGEMALPDSLRRTMQDLATEHLQNAIKVLMSLGVIVSDPRTPNDLSSLTWDAVSRMGIGKENNRFRNAIFLEKRVAIALWRPALGDSFRSIGKKASPAVASIHDF